MYLGRRPWCGVRDRKKTRMFKLVAHHDENRFEMQRRLSYMLSLCHRAEPKCAQSGKMIGSRKRNRSFALNTASTIVNGVVAYVTPSQHAQGQVHNCSGKNPQRR